LGTVRFVDLLLPVVALLFLAALLAPRIRENIFWQATVTPLASIIGSGFLIVAPMLGGIVGIMTPWVMLMIVVFAYLIGGVMRFNIYNVEPLLSNGKASNDQRFVEHLSNLTLFVAYIISVAFYLRLMSSFILRGFGMFTSTNANALTTAVLLFIGIAGWRRGLKGLELLEEYSVSVKLAIIGTLLLGLGFYGTSTGIWHNVPDPQDRPILEILRLLAGMLLVVQGFETSRYLGQDHSADQRVHSMRFAQCLSAFIYVGFAFLILPLIQYLPSGHFDETAIIDISHRVSVVLPMMLIVGAAMSQFSAAVADTLGGGGLLVEESRARLSPGQCYLAISACAIALVWSTSIFEIIAYASRAFAFYYFSQTVLAIQVVITWPSNWRKWTLLTWFGLIASILAWVVVFAVPVD
jgi:hypothetical protein